MTKAKQYKGVTFDFKKAHLAYTEESQGGAASLLNDPIMLKAKNPDEALSENQKKILKVIGEESTPLEKSSEVVKESQSSSEENGEDNVKINKGTDNDMSEKLIKSLQDEVAILKAKNIEQSINPYELSEDVAKGLTEVMLGVTPEQCDNITKALNELVSYGVAGVEIEKANTPATEEENALAKALSEEQGEEGKTEEEGKPTFLQKAIEAQDAIKEEAK
jgi:hypothetical protein